MSFCQDCKIFQEMHKGRIGGGLLCHKDSTPESEGGKRRVYARDYACSGIVKEDSK